MLPKVTSWTWSEYNLPVSPRPRPLSSPCKWNWRHASRNKQNILILKPQTKVQRADKLKGFKKQCMTVSGVMLPHMLPHIVCLIRWEVTLVTSVRSGRDRQATPAALSSLWIAQCRANKITYRARIEPYWCLARPGFQLGRGQGQHAPRTLTYGRVVMRDALIWIKQKHLPTNLVLHTY